MFSLPTPTKVSPLNIAIRAADGEQAVDEARGWSVDVVPESWDGPGTQLRIRATWNGFAPTNAGLIVRLPLGAETVRRMLVPALFYGDNGQGSRSTRYPRLGAFDQTDFTAPAWDFPADRAALPAVFAWTEETFRWLAVEPNGSGLGFNTVDGAAELRVHKPALQQPWSYDRAGEAPAAPLSKVMPGASLELLVWFGAGDPADANAFAVVQRALQSAWGYIAPRSVDKQVTLDAASAAFEGLLRWHNIPAIKAAGKNDAKTAPRPAILAETVSFAGEKRDAMHVGWISGTPAAYALLSHALKKRDQAAAAAARAVIDTVGLGLAPCGAFWGEWTPNGWKAGWNGHPHKLHARTLAEATLFMLRALLLERDHLVWDGAIRSNLEFVLRAMDAQGNPGAYYHALTGQVMDRRGTAGLLWVAALVVGARLFGSASYLAAAKRIGDFYADAITNGELLGAPEDIGLCPSSEDGYNAVIAMMALYEATGEQRWLDLAQKAADWTLTFRWSYDVSFPAGSTLDRRGFQSRGADSASPSNIHMHCYGLICQPELLRLSAALGDSWYADRAADHLACFLGEVVLSDGQFGGLEKRGMMVEQLYTSNWSLEGRAGEVGQVSHAWCLGLLLLAADNWLDATQATGATDAERQHTQVTRAKKAKALPVDAPHPLRLLPGLYQVGGGGLSTPSDASSYLLLDESSGECLLIDCGSHRGLPALRANIDKVADIKKLQYVIGTHCHFDHVEAFGHLRADTNAKFALHAAEIAAVESGDPDMTCAGFLYHDTFHPFHVDIPLHGGEKFHVGLFDLEVLHLPGHSPGCIGLKAHYTLTGQTILFPGDAIHGAFSNKLRSNVPVWKKSLRRLLDDDFDLMVPTHIPAPHQTSLQADVALRIATVYKQLEQNFHGFIGSV